MPVLGAVSVMSNSYSAEIGSSLRRPVHDVHSLAALAPHICSDLFVRAIVHFWAACMWWLAAVQCALICTHSY